MVTRGERPPQPVHAEALGLTLAIWKLTKRCWHKAPGKRPDTPEILSRLESMSLSMCLNIPATDDMGISGGNLSFVLEAVEKDLRMLISSHLISLRWRTGLDFPCLWGLQAPGGVSRPVRRLEAPWFMKVV